jgi:hypothetical protein
MVYISMQIHDVRILHVQDFRTMLGLPEAPTPTPSPTPTPTPAPAPTPTPGHNNKKFGPLYLLFAVINID